MGSIEKGPKPQQGIGGWSRSRSLRAFYSMDTRWPSGAPEPYPPSSFFAPAVPGVDDEYLRLKVTSGERAITE